MTVSSQTETWKTVQGASMVAVSDQGNVWSHRTHRLLAARPQNKGYLIVSYIDDTGCRLTRAVGPLVLAVHVGPRPPGMECCHGPGGKTDNRLVNLRWDTPESNRIDRHGEWRPCSHCRGRGYVYGA